MTSLIKQLIVAAGISIACGAAARADTLDFSGSVSGTFSGGSAGRCAPFPTFDANGTGVATLLGALMDFESACRSSDSTFDDGTFQFTSIASPQDSLFGTYFAVASEQDSVLDFTSILLITGGTGLFAGDFGAIFGNGTFDENTALFQETLSGQLQGSTPEPGSSILIATVFAALWLLRRARSGRPRST